MCLSKSPLKEKLKRQKIQWVELCQIKGKHSHECKTREGSLIFPKRVTVVFNIRSFSGKIMHYARGFVIKLPAKIMMSQSFQSRRNEIKTYFSWFNHLIYIKIQTCCITLFNNRNCQDKFVGYIWDPLD